MANFQPPRDKQLPTQIRKLQRDVTTIQHKLENVALNGGGGGGTGSGASIDTLAGDIQPLGQFPQAGSTGLAADAGHVHPNTGVALIDTTITDIMPLGTRSAGGSGLAADASHVHPTDGLITSQTAASGDLGGVYPGPVVKKLNGLTVAASPGGTTTYLRADGTWAAPPGGSGGSGNLDGGDPTTIPVTGASADGGTP